MTRRRATIALALLFTLSLLAGGLLISRSGPSRTHIVAYFDNSNGLYRGDEVRILGVPVGTIDSIEPQPHRAKVTFWVNSKYKVPADVKAAVLSPQLITSRAIQLSPVYSSGPVMADGAVIPQDRTAVPVEWDDLRQQLEKLANTLQPTQPGGVSTLGAFIDTAADNLRGQGANIRDTLVKTSQALSILGDHSNDIFTTITNLSVIVSALQDSGSLLRQLNVNLASVTALLTDDPDQVGQAVEDIHGAVADATQFISENREALGTATDKLSSISKAVTDSLDDIKQTLHLAPTTFQNFVNIWQPTPNALTGALVVNNFANPITFLCGAIQAASRLGADQSAKLCVQYLAPIIKNRQYNFPPLGENLFVGATARPNELTYTEDWMRPDHVPAPPNSPPPAPAPLVNPPLPAEAAAPPAESPVTTNPADGLTGMIVPPGGGS